MADQADEAEHDQALGYEKCPCAMCDTLRRAVEEERDVLGRAQGALTRALEGGYFKLDELDCKRDSLEGSALIGKCRVLLSDLFGQVRINWTIGDKDHQPQFFVNHVGAEDQV